MNTKERFPIGGSPTRFLLMVGALLLLSSPALAQKSSSPRVTKAAQTRTAHIDVVESGSKSGRTHTASMSVSLLGDGVPSRLEAHIAGADYRIVVNQRARAGGHGHTTELSVKSSQRSGGHTILNVDARAVTPLGKRIVVSRVANPDGTHFEIALTLR